MKPTKNDKKKAKELGKKAFLDGKKAIPLYDKEIQDLLKGREVGEGLPLLKVWLKAWHTANINKEAILEKAWHFPSLMVLLIM